MSQLENLCKEMGIKLTVKDPPPMSAAEWEKLDDWKKNSHHYLCTVRYKGKSMTVPFWMGKGHMGKDPTCADVVSALVSDATAGELDYHDFISEFGHKDNRESMRVWKACEETLVSMRRVFGDELEKLASAEH